MSDLPPRHSRPLITADGVELSDISLGVAPAPRISSEDQAVAPGADHDHHRLIWPLGGLAAHVTAGAQTVLVRAPDAVWVRARAPLDVHGDHSIGIARFRARTCPSAWSHTTTLMLHPGVTALLEWLPEQHSRPWAPDVVSAITEQLAVGHARAPMAVPLPADPQIRAVALALLDDPSDRRGVAVLAREAGYVERTFRRRFVAETGLTFAAWRAKLRIDTAMAMIEAGRAVDDVADACGYASTTGFARAFKAATGLPPSRFADSTERIVPLLRGQWPLMRDVLGEVGEVDLRLRDNPAFSTRAAMLAAAGMLLLATACSDSATDDAAPTSAESMSETNSSATNTQRSDQPSTTASDAPNDPVATDADPGVDVSASDPGTGTVAVAELRATDLRGVEVSLDSPPERVVSVWDSVDAQNLLALGIEPVLIGRVGGGRPAPWVDDYAGIETYDLGEATNIEVIAAAMPDLIVTASYDDEAYPLLEEISPLYVADNSVPWRDELRNLAALVGRDDTAEAVIDDRQQVIDDAAARLSAWSGTSLVAGVVAPGDGGFVVFTDESPLSALLEEIGFAPLTPSPDGGATATYSLELLGELEGDALLFLDVSGIAGQDLSALNEAFLSGEIVGTIPATDGGIAEVGTESSAAARLVNAANLPYLVKELADTLETTLSR
ncbi:MAG: AraC family transcriptional regulator [Actinomycetota bacterium]